MTFLRHRYRLRSFRRVSSASHETPKRSRSRMLAYTIRTAPPPHQLHHLPRLPSSCIAIWFSRFHFGTLFFAASLAPLPVLRQNVLFLFRIRTCSSVLFSCLFSAGRLLFVHLSPCSHVFSFTHSSLVDCLLLVGIFSSPFLMAFCFICSLLFGNHALLSFSFMKFMIWKDLYDAWLRPRAEYEEGRGKERMGWMVTKFYHRKFGT